MLFNTIDFFPGCFAGLLRVAGESEIYLAFGRQLLFLYVLESGLYYPAVIFYIGYVCMRPYAGMDSGEGRPK